MELYYQHRVNKDIPVKEVAGVMGDLIKAGKILDWDQSQATEEEIRRAHDYAAHGHSERILHDGAYV